MSCPHCGANNPEGSRFCFKCGGPLAAPSGVPATQAPATPAPAVQAPADAPAPVKRTSPTTLVILAGIGLFAFVMLFVVGAGAFFVIRAASHRTVAQQGGIRPPAREARPAARATQPGGPAAPQPGGPPPPAPVTPPLPAPPGAPGPGQPAGPGAQAPATQPQPPAAAPAPATQPPPPAPALGGAPVPLPTPPGTPTDTGAPGVQMQRYRGGGGQFAIDYPEGWQVKEAPAQGTAVFYKDDPDEGTSFAVIPFQRVQGEGNARQVIELIAQAIRRQYPDFKVSVQGVKDVGQAGLVAQAMDADASWTGAHQQRMRGTILLYTFTTQGSGFTTYIFMGGQAPTVAFDSVRPIFVKMMQSFGQ